MINKKCKCGPKCEKKKVGKCCKRVVTEDINNPDGFVVSDLIHGIASLLGKNFGVEWMKTGYDIISVEVIAVDTLQINFTDEVTMILATTHDDNIAMWAFGSSADVEFIEEENLGNKSPFNILLGASEVFIKMVPAPEDRHTVV